VAEEGIAPIRRWLVNNGFSEWYPHITIGFIGSDVHGVPKLPQTSSTVILTKDELDLCKCILHPKIKLKPKSFGDDEIEFVDISALPVPGLGDDQTYSRYPEIVSLVPRGLVYAQCRISKTDRDKKWVCVLRGLTKFTGTVGNDDDIDLADMQANEVISELVGSSSSSVSFRRSKKENGRSGGFSVVEDFGNGNYLVCVGTKLSHILTLYNINSNTFSLDQKMIDDDGFNLLIRNIEAYKNSFEIGLDNRKRLFKFLGLFTTLNTEVLDYEDQHIEPLPIGILKAVSLSVVRDGSYEATGLAQLREIGVPCVGVGPVEPIENFFPAVKEMKRGRTEGYVVQFLDANDSITGLLKVKSVWYIAVRSIREMTKSKLIQPLVKASESKKGKGTPPKTDSKKERSPSLDGGCGKKGVEVSEWLRSGVWEHKFDFLRGDVEQDQFEPLLRGIVRLAGEFVVWYGQQLDEGKFALAVDPFVSGFPSVWSRFLSEGHDEAFLLMGGEGGGEKPVVVEGEKIWKVWKSKREK
jgi:hypothetical protein